MLLCQETRHCTGYSSDAGGRTQLAPFSASCVTEFSGRADAINEFKEILDNIKVMTLPTIYFSQTREFSTKDKHQ